MKLVSFGHIEFLLWRSLNVSRHYRLVKGTDATMAEHIKKIQERSYVTKTADRFLVPTNLGIALVEGQADLTLFDYEPAY